MKLSPISTPIVICVCLISCKETGLNKSNKEDCITKFNRECLTATELASITMSALSKKDSALLATNYIREWKLQQALYKEAENNVVIDEQDLNQLIANVKKQYYISAYLKKYVQENLDTQILNKDIVDYYQLHKSAFKLTSSIVQIYYIKFSDNEKDINEFKKLFAGKDKSKLMNFIIEKSSSYFIEDSLWIKWDDLVKEAPFLKNYSVQNIPKGKTIEWRDGNFYYYLKIKDYKVKDEYSPLIYEKDKIKKTILNERKNQLINELKNNILQKIENRK